MEKKIVGVFVSMLLIAATVALPVAGNTSSLNTSGLGEVKDQYQEWSDECIYISDYEWQEFVPTMDNLVRVEVKIVQWYGGSPDLKLTVEKPLGNVLTLKELPASVIPSGTCDWVSFDVPDIPLTSGDSYYIKLTAPLDSEYGWGIAYNGLYPNGSSSQDPADWCFRTFASFEATIPGIKFSVVDFMLGDVKGVNSGWGHVEVDINEFLEHQQMNKGYLNVYSDAGWVVQNLLVDEVEGMDSIATYFNLVMPRGENLASISVHIEFSDSPQNSFGDGPRTIYDLDTVIHNAEGLGPEERTELSQPPPVLEYIPPAYTWDFTKPLRRGENVQCAYMQCGPMGVANSLQYLENEYTSINIPHTHTMGLKGDNTLVGKLDSAMNRLATSRWNGGGVSCPQLLEGKFEYLNDNGLADKLIHKHQGYGYFGMTAGDFTHAGITSTDESAAGGKVTFDWIHTQLVNCEDVEVGIKWGGGGGHIVRIFGCGETAGKPYLRYAHDRTQTYRDADGNVKGDNVGLESGQVYVDDLDGDGMMNWGSADDEIVFALSESPQPFITVYVVYIWGGFGIGATLGNTGEEEVQVEWSIKLDGFVLLGGYTEGTISIPPGEEINVQTGFILGFGPTTITVTADGASKTASCFLLGPFALGVK
ncbi:MAG TPA: hypothetical protein ENI42_01880 [Thermoplasmatales archaeon]|nr:hypothetical protein [Thermoplasmatales archaeon]